MEEEYLPAEEEEKVLSIFLTYRLNSSYEKWGQTIEKALAEEGFRVISKIFPQNTDIKEIKQWLTEHPDQLSSVNGFIGDNTVLSNSGYDFYKTRINQVSLDQIIRDATLTSFFNKDSRQLRSEEEEYRMSTHRDATEKGPAAINNYLQHVGRAVVAIVSHFDNSRKKDSDYYICTGNQKAPLGTPLAGHEPFFKKEDQEPINRDFAEKIAGWLKEAGVDKIHIVDHIWTLDAEEKDIFSKSFDEGKVIAIFNRHWDVIKGMFQKSANIMLEMPIETFLVDAIENVPELQNIVKENIIKEQIRSKIREELKGS